MKRKNPKPLKLYAAPAERKAIKAHAKKMSMSVSTFIRQAVLKTMESA